MAQYAIEVRDLTRIYEQRNEPPVRALQGISFDVRSGEIFGLLGPNGAGKTTTLKILTTLLLPTTGSARVLGHDVVRDPLGVRKQICVVVQENAVELYLSLRNNFKTFGRFHGVSAKEIEQRTDRVCDLFGLREHMNAKGVDLSGGLKRRLQVAKMFIVDKPIVFLDEATTGMDAFNKRATINAIKEESRRGRTIVLTTHMLDEAEELCDSLAIINHGQVIAHGSTSQVKSMGLRLLYISLSFEKMTKNILQIVKRWKPLKIDVKNTSMEVTAQDERNALGIVNDARKTKLLNSFEITNASLEDVFVELVDKKERA